MTGHTTAAVGLAGTVLAAVTGGPIAQTFDEMALALALWGGLGGIAFGVANRSDWREIGRGAALGALMGAGFGVIGPQVVHAAVKVDILETGARVLSGCAFAIGFTQDVVIRFVRRGRK